LRHDVTESLCLVQGTATLDRGLEAAPGAGERIG
jgi:hypothetical protein